MDDPKNKALSLPETPGVYQMIDKSGAIIYIGKARNLRRRVSSYFLNRQESGKTTAMVGRIHDIHFIACESEKEALLLEANLIKQHNPRYNIQLRDSKQFPYMRITMAEDFPRILKTRAAEKQGEKSFGPFPNVAALTQTIKLLHRLFPFRYCNRKLVDGKKNGSVCLYYHINRCPGPCEALISSEAYRENIERVILFMQGKYHEILASMQEQMNSHTQKLEYEQAAILRDKIEAVRSATEQQAVHVLSGLPSPNLDVVNWHTMMGIAAFSVLCIREGKLSGQKLYIEKKIDEKPDPLGQFLSRHVHALLHAPELTEALVAPSLLVVPETPDATIPELNAADDIDILSYSPLTAPPVLRRLLVQARRNAVYALEEAVSKRLYRDGLQELGHLLRLDAPPEVIEGFDIATIMGEETVAGMVYFHNGKPVRSRHRHFIMRTVEGQDDFASIREAVARRYQRLLNEEKPLPDLILIDGGRGQLNAALQSLRALGLDTQPVASLAKKEELVFVPWQEAPIRMNKHQFPLRILQNVRDAVHDLVNGFHRKRRDAKRVTSKLLHIAGIGEVASRKLLKSFGSVSRIGQASMEELTAVLHNKKQSAAVYDYFQKENTKNRQG